MASFTNSAQHSMHNTHIHEGIGEDTPLLNRTRASHTLPADHELINGEHESNETFCEFLKGSKANFLYFFIALFVPPVLAIYIFIGDEESFSNGYIISGIFGISTSLYGLNHFRLLFKLKHEVDAYTTKNELFKTERIQIKNQIDKLSSCNSILKNKRDSIHQSNLKMNNMIRDLDAMEDRLRALGKQTKGNLKGIGKRTNKARNKYYDIAVCQQKTLLSKLFQRLERRGTNEKGLDRDDYKIFCGLLPKEYQDRFERLGGFEAWCEISGNKKDYIDKEDFTKGLEIYAQMHVENSDIAFKIDKTKLNGKDDQKGKAVYDREVKILSHVRRKSFYLTKDVVWNVDDNETSPTPLDKEPGMLQKRRGIKHVVDL